MNLLRQAINRNFMERERNINKINETLSRGEESHTATKLILRLNSGTDSSEDDQDKLVTMIMGDQDAQGTPSTTKRLSDPLLDPELLDLEA
ncbi:UNVERIFIED_CONTAM: hypothetical protein K2H54_033483 [Gekko kuhli]